MKFGSRRISANQFGFWFLESHELGESACETKTS